MLEEIFKTYWPFILPLVTGFGGWWVSRESRGLINAMKLIEMYEMLIDQIKNQLSDSDTVITALKDTIRTMQPDNESCKNTLNALERDYVKLKNLYNSQLARNRELQAELVRMRKVLGKSKTNN